MKTSKMWSQLPYSEGEAFIFGQFTEATRKSNAALLPLAKDSLHAEKNQ